LHTCNEIQRKQLGFISALGCPPAHFKNCEWNFFGTDDVDDNEEEETNSNCIGSEGPSIFK